MSFERENRYIVVKRSDLEKYVPAWLRTKLQEMLEDVNYAIVQGRFNEGKPTLKQYVCVEDDWPEYEPVWVMIQKRVENEQRQREKAYRLAERYGMGQQRFKYAGTHEGSTEFAALPQNLPRKEGSQDKPEKAKAYCPTCKKDQSHHGDPDSIHLHLCDVCNDVVDY